MSEREYHNYKDLRIMVTDDYEDVEGWHHHEHTDQIVYVICGMLEIIAEGIHNLSNRQSICIPAGMMHKISALEPDTKIFVIKYRSTGKNLINDIIADYVK